MSPQDIEALRNGIAELLSARCDSRALHRHVEQPGELERSLWSEAAALGWFALGLPEDDGGLGMGPAGLAILYEELGRRLAPAPFAATLSAAQWISEACPEAVRRDWLEAVVAGELRIAVDAARPERAGDDGRAPRLLLGSSTSGLALMSVGAGSAATWVLARPNASALKPQPLWDMTREYCRFAPDDGEILWSTPDPDGLLGRRIDQLLCLAAAGDSVGGAQAIVDQTVDYLKVRTQFGRPIGSFQALKHRLADLAVLRETNARLVAQALGAEGEAYGALWAAIAKASATEAYRVIAADALQLHGGIGFTWEHDCHLYLKRARANEMLVDHNEALRDFAASELFRFTRDGETVAEIAA